MPSGDHLGFTTLAQNYAQPQMRSSTFYARFTSKRIPRCGDNDLPSCGCDQRGTGMLEQRQTLSNLAELISVARQKKGWATLKELYREKSPEVDYQSWLHAESGRRIPHPKNLLEMGAILEINKEDLIIAYCKDKFDDDECHRIVDSFLFKKFINVDTLLEANMHNHITHIFTAEQMAAMRDDIRVRLYLSYTYNKDLQTTVSRLARFFKVSFSEAKEVVDKLESIGLIDLDGEAITRRHRHLDMPTSPEVFELRKNLMVAGLKQNIKPSSHITNFHVRLNEESFKKVMAFIYFAEANFLKLTKEDHQDKNKKGEVIQISIAVNKVNEGFEDDQN